MRNRLRPFKRTANSDFGCFRGQLTCAHSKSRSNLDAGGAMRLRRGLTADVHYRHCGAGVHVCPTSLMPRPCCTRRIRPAQQSTSMRHRRRCDDDDTSPAAASLYFALTIPDLCHNVPSLPTEAGVTSRREASRQDRPSSNEAMHASSWIRSFHSRSACSRSQSPSPPATRNALVPAHAPGDPCPEPLARPGTPLPQAWPAITQEHALPGDRAPIAQRRLGGAYRRAEFHHRLVPNHGPLSGLPGSRRRAVSPARPQDLPHRRRIPRRGIHARSHGGYWYRSRRCARRRRSSSPRWRCNRPHPAKPAAHHRCAAAGCRIATVRAHSCKRRARRG